MLDVRSFLFAALTFCHAGAFPFTDSHRAILGKMNQTQQAFYAATQVRGDVISMESIETVLHKLGVAGQRQANGNPLYNFLRFKPGPKMTVKSIQSHLSKCYVNTLDLVAQKKFRWNEKGLRERHNAMWHQLPLIADI